jgi:DNA repair exonuclease SbcCD ATPase subunit
MPKYANGDEITQPEPQPQAGDQSIPKARFDEVNGKLKDAVRAMEEQGKSLAQLQAKIKETEDKGLAEQGKFKDLYDKEKVEREKLLPLADQLKAYNEKLTALNAERRKAIPDDLKDIVPQSFPSPIDEYEYLEKFIGKLPSLKNPGAAPAGQRPGAGGGGAPDDIKVLEAELAELNKSGNYSQNNQMRKIQLTDAIQQLKSKR